MTCLLPSNIPPLAILRVSCWFRFTGFVRRTSIFRLQTHETTLDERECERAGTSLMAAMSGSRYPRQTFLALISPGRHLLLEISGTPLQPSMFSHSIFIFSPPFLIEGGDGCSEASSRLLARLRRILEIDDRGPCAKRFRAQKREITLFSPSTTFSSESRIFSRIRSNTKLFAESCFDLSLNI